MKHYKRLGLYKASNVTFDPVAMEAISYGWWKFVRVISGRVVFNNYRYSVTTAAHQRKVLSVMRGLGIEPDLTIRTVHCLSKFSSTNGLLQAHLETLNEEARNEEYKRFKRNKRARERRLAAKEVA